MSAAPHVGPPLDDVDRRQADLPPVQVIGTVTLGLLVAGGIVMAAQMNRSTSLTLPAIFVGLAVLGFLSNLVLLSRIKSFAWATFRMVLKWAVLAYGVVAGILEFVFIYDKTPGKLLAMFSIMLIVFALNVPLILAYAVARYQDVPE